MEDISIKRYNVSDLIQYIKTSLGGNIFSVELDNDAIIQAITDALLEYSKRIPLVAHMTMQISPSVRVYPLPDTGYGVFYWDFIQPDPKPSALFYANLLDVAPVKASTMESYDIFLRWRKTFMRVTSVAPQAEWDELNNVMVVYAPVDGTNMCVAWHQPRNLSQVRLEDQDWIRKYTLAKCKFTLSQVRDKFSGVLPGPAQNLQLNGAKLAAEATTEIEKLEAFLLAKQGDVGLIVD